MVNPTLVHVTLLAPDHAPTPIDHAAARARVEEERERVPVRERERMPVRVAVRDRVPVRVRVRPITAEDAPRLVEFHEALSPETVYLRFFTAHPHLSAGEVDRFTHVDGSDRLALVALDGERLIGVGRYERSAAEPRSAEVAFVVADEYQGHGIGSMLLHQLAAYAVGAGITTFSAVTLIENRSMQQVFRHSGFPCHARYDGGLVAFRMDISPA